MKIGDQNLVAFRSALFETNYDFILLSTLHRYCINMDFFLPKCVVSAERGKFCLYAVHLAEQEAGLSFTSSLSGHSAFGVMTLISSHTYQQVFHLEVRFLP